MNELLTWDIYTIRPTTDPITGVKFRGRLRKYCVGKQCNVLVENAQDEDGCVRFAVPTGSEVDHIKDYIASIAASATVELSEENVPNPVLSKLKVNILSRYE